MPINRRGFAKNMKGIDTRAINVENLIGQIQSSGILSELIQTEELEVGSITFSQVNGAVNFNNQSLSNVNISSGSLVNVDQGTFTNVTVNGNLNLTLTTSEIQIAGNKVVGARQAASPTVPDVTTAGANVGASGVGLSLIGNTTAADQSLALMNDLKALQEDITNLKVAVDGIRTVLQTHGLMS